jgi:hypothetical protein
MAIHWSTAQLGSALSRWIGLGFASGSACFLIGPFPGYVQLLGAEADGITFFVGSLVFTAAAKLQALSTHGGDRLPSLIQFAGTIFFNVNTFRAMQTSISNSQVDRLIWAPEAAGSACFLISGAIAYQSVRATGHAVRRNREWRTAAVNLAGCVLFGISTIASYVVPETGDVVALAAANWTTALGALCFLA